MVGCLVDSLPDTRLARHIAGQLVRSGTSAAPNYEEARAGESRADFIHKLSICLKEMRESRVWIQMIVRCRLLPREDCVVIAREADELCNILGASLVTAKRNSENSREAS
jgi:four helix bundle protein